MMWIIVATIFCDMIWTVFGDCSTCTANDWKCGDIKSTEHGYNVCEEDNPAYFAGAECTWCCAVDSDDLCYCKSEEDCQESAAMPSWIWWAIIALVVFLLMLTFWIYKYWYMSRRTRAALAANDDDLDDIMNEDELGFGNDIDSGDLVNPLKTAE
eukprot:193409_1